MSQLGSAFNPEQSQKPPGAFDQIKSVWAIACAAVGRPHWVQASPVVPRTGDVRDWGTVLIFGCRCGA